MACEGLLLTETRTAPLTAMPAVSSPALLQTTCRVQLQLVASAGPKLLHARAHPEHLRLWNAAMPRSVRSGAERNEADDLPPGGKLYNIPWHPKSKVVVMRRPFSASSAKGMLWKEQLGAPGLPRGGAEKRMAVRLSIAGCET